MRNLAGIFGNSTLREVQYDQFSGICCLQMKKYAHLTFSVKNLEIVEK